MRDGVICWGLLPGTRPPCHAPMHIPLTRAHFLGRVLLLTAGGLSVFYTSPPPTRAAAITAEMANSSPDYEAWDAAVRAHVRPTEIRGIGLNSVDYQGMRNDPNFATFLNSIKNAKTTGLGKDAEYALWINAYNALAIAMVNDNPCKKRFFGLKKCKVVGIREVGTLISPVWKRPAGTVGGETVSLDEIEHAKLRAPEGYPADPLLHACIVCASVSCPDVAPKAYKPETLQADMEENMRLFLQNPTKGLSLDKAAGVITLSKVFLWFAEDFTTKVGNASVLDTLLPYMPEDVKTYVSEHKDELKINHFEYDWGLNGPPPGAAGKNGRC